MNATVYVFCKLNGKYSQYPDDYTKTLFDKFRSLSGAGAKMVIHRDGDLMYYGYIRQLTRKEDYMGFCILLNGVMLTGIEPLAVLFEKVYDAANVFFTVEMAERVSAMIKEGVAEMECVALPPVAYGISNEETKRFADVKDNEAIVGAAAMYPWVVADINVKRRASGKREVVTPSREKTTNGSKNRNIVFVVAIAILSVTLIVSLVALRNSNIEKRNEMEKRDEVEKMLAAEKVNYEMEKGERIRIEAKYKEFKEDVGADVPIIITKVEVANTYYGGDIETDYGEKIYSWTTMYLKPKIYYKLVGEPKSITLRVKLYDSSGDLSQGKSSPSDCSFTRDLYVSNTGVAVLSGWGNSQRGNYRSGWYRFEFWYGDMCLGSKRFYIW